MLFHLAIGLNRVAVSSLAVLPPYICKPHAPPSPRRGGQDGLAANLAASNTVGSSPTDSCVVRPSSICSFAPLFPWVGSERAKARHAAPLLSYDLAGLSSCSAHTRPSLSVGSLAMSVSLAPSPSSESGRWRLPFRITVTVPLCWYRRAVPNATLCAPEMLQLAHGSHILPPRHRTFAGEMANRRPASLSRLIISVYAHLGDSDNTAFRHALDSPAAVKPSCSLGRVDSLICKRVSSLSAVAKEKGTGCQLPRVC